MENKEKTFKETLEALSAKELILLMVDSIENPVTRIDMSTYGRIENGICYGCAATNTILKLSRGKLEPEALCERDVYGYKGPVEFGQVATSIGLDRNQLKNFESAINALRCGYIPLYREYQRLLRSDGVNIPVIKLPLEVLPVICTNYTQEDLNAYRKLAELQEN